MRPFESPLESYKSKRILFIAYLISSSVLKNVSAICQYSISEKIQNIFEIGLKKYGVIVQKSLSEENIWKYKIRTHVFVVHVPN